MSTTAKTPFWMVSKDFNTVTKASSFNDTIADPDSFVEWIANRASYIVLRPLSEDDMRWLKRHDQLLPKRHIIWL